MLWITVIGLCITVSFLWITVKELWITVVGHVEYLRYACLPHRQEKFFMLYIHRSSADYAVKS